MLGIVFGLYRVLKSPARQGTFVIAVALARFLAALAVLYSAAAQEIDVYPFWILLPIAADGTIAVLLVLGWRAARPILDSGAFPQLPDGGRSPGSLRPAFASCARRQPRTAFRLASNSGG